MVFLCPPRRASLAFMFPDPFENFLANLIAYAFLPEKPDIYQAQELGRLAVF